MKNSILLIIIAVFINCLNLSAQDIDINEIESKIDAMVPESIDETTPGLVIGIVKDGELLFSKGYGMANLSYDIPNSPKLVYNTGSVTKQFLGYAFAMLHSQKKLSLDDAVDKYMDDWPKFDEVVTLKHLLTHSSGYREAYAMSNFAGRSVGVDRLSREECLEVIRRQPELEYKPGSRYTYNSTAWVVLAEVLEKVTATPADQWVVDNILKPLDMKDTQIETFVGDVIKNAAESYVRRPDGQFENLKSNRAIFGAADIYSSIEDLAKWIRNLKTAEVGGKEVHELFLKPHILNDGVNSGYALGIGVSNYKGVKRYRHTGGHEAFATQLSYYPDQDLGIVTISNYGGTGWLNTAEIAEMLIGSQMNENENEIETTILLDENKLKSFTGSYIADTYNRTMDVTVDDGMLTLDRNTSLIPISENQFKEKGGELKVMVVPSGKGVKELVLTSNSTQKYLPYKSWSPTAEQLKEFKGEYKSAELDVIHKVETVDGKLNVSNRWVEAQTLQAVTEDVFKIGNAYFIKFLRDESGQIKGYNINTGRTLNVFFKKLN